MGDAPLQPWGNATTHNLESVLQQNINSSRYYLGLQHHEFNDLVDEIYNEARTCSSYRAAAPSPRADMRAAHCAGDARGALDVW